MPYAEELNYWKTGKSAPDKIIDSVMAMIGRAGGQPIAQAYGMEEDSRRSAWMVEFAIDDQLYKVVWPVLPCKHPNPANIRAARIQAATMLSHDVKARLISARVLGSRKAFFSYLVLPTGQVASDLVSPGIIADIPTMLGGSELIALPEPDMQH